MSGRRYKFTYAARRDRPDDPVAWPFEFDIVEPARWPAKHWPTRRAMARPLRALNALLRRISGGLGWAADLVEGQPLIQVYWQDGWHRSMRIDARYPYQYIGDITPQIVAMYRHHPERFAGTEPFIIDRIKACIGADE